MYNGLMYNHLVIIAKQPCWDLFFCDDDQLTVYYSLQKKRECKDYVYMYNNTNLYIIIIYLEKYAIYAKCLKRHLTTKTEKY